MKSRILLLMGCTCFVHWQPSCWHLFTQSATAQIVGVGGSIPVFQYEIFYNLNLEMYPGNITPINGPVFCNSNIWEGSSVLVFNSTVQAAGTNNTSATDPFALNYPSGSSAAPYSGTPLADFTLGTPSSNNQPLTIPIGTNSSPKNLEVILNLPPAGLGAPNAAAYAPSNQVYLFNECDLIISNSFFGTNGVAFRSGLGTTVNTLATNFTVWFQDHYHTPILQKLTNDYIIQKQPGTNYASTNILYAGYSFLTNTIFYDWREGWNSGSPKAVQAVQIDIAKFQRWLTNGSVFASGTGYQANQIILGDFGHGIGSIYIYNNASSTSTTLPAVRLVNGGTLPTNYPGLTIATPQPLYIYGDYNVENNIGNDLGTNRTTHTYPSALMADAITILSDNWSDSVTSKLPISSSTTVNAAMLAGIVPSNPTISGDYSGGMENFFRLLEDWSSGKILTWNGSMVAMFPSIYATNHWKPTGNYYNAPTRHWAFDNNFTNLSKLPQLTPLPMNLNPPEITAQPQSQNVAWGSNATFSVTAIGYSPMSYQWNFNTTNILGATNASLTLSNVQPSQADAYSVTVTNIYGNVTSSNAVLSIFQTSSQLTFATASTNAVGSIPISLTVADVNGDGKLDLITANAGDNTLAVLTNNGSGIFEAPIPLSRWTVIRDAL